ncbi:dopaminechrome tautomerase-like [Euwallacea similis]|uniref:dopaminechrome tautomerase-like n=1 Tax=Euwallacea similis TaxID=1736056 RepID=UPI00344F7500
MGILKRYSRWKSSSLAERFLSQAKLPKQRKSLEKLIGRSRSRNSAIKLKLLLIHTEISSKDYISNVVQQSEEKSNFKVVYRWPYLNFTWNSPEEYYNAITSGRYIPENNAPTGMKLHLNRIFLTIPRFRKGIPATLNYIDMMEGHEEPLLTPFPDWKSNDEAISCSNLQSVQSMEIDTGGIMWVIDGVRINNSTLCPAKLVLLDLKNGGLLVHTYVFPDGISSRNGGFLNDIVIDESDGNYAYITDNSPIDPGVVVYSRRRNTSWKLRDKSMLPEPHAVEFPVDDLVFRNPVPVDGIALSPKKIDKTRTLFYCAISSFTIYSVPTNVLKNRLLVKSGLWRAMIKKEGQKSGQSDGIIIDELSTMYLTMLPQHGVASWNIKQPISTMEIIDSNRETMIWPDGLAFDQNGFLYLISNKIYNYIDSTRTPIINGQPQFRVLRAFTGTRSYLYG